MSKFESEKCLENTQHAIHISSLTGSQKTHLLPHKVGKRFACIAGSVMSGLWAGSTMASYSQWWHCPLTSLTLVYLKHWWIFTGFKYKHKKSKRNAGGGITLVKTILWKKVSVACIVIDEEILNSHTEVDDLKLSICNCNISPESSTINNNAYYEDLFGLFQTVIHDATEDEYKCLAHVDFRSGLLQDCIVMVDNV